MELSEEAAIVIDNGSHTCRAGWSTNPQPRLKFRPVVGKARAKKGGEESLRTYVGNDVLNADIALNNLRTPFDSNVVTRLDVQEQILDHIFTNLRIDGDHITNPIVMTEVLCNPSYCRQQMSELLFECYGAPSVCYGVDALFSYFYNKKRLPSEGSDGLIISSGNLTTHHLLIADQKLDGSAIKRIPLGGGRATDFLQQALQLKYPYEKTLFAPLRVEQMKEQHCYVALDYLEELRLFQHDRDFTNKQMRTIAELNSGPAPVEKIISEEEQQRRTQARREQGLRLKAMAENRRKEKRKMQEEELKDLKATKALKETDLKKYEVTSDEAGDFGSELTARALRHSLPQKRLKVLRLNEVQLSKTIADLTKSLQPKERKKRDDAKERKWREEEDERLKDPEGWASQLRDRRAALLAAIEGRRRRKEVEGGRRGTASAKRMRALASAAFERKGRARDEDVDASFGANDSDWNVYRTMAGDEEEEEEAKENEEVKKIEKMLERHGESIKAPSVAIKNPLFDLSKFFMATERVRVPEIFFQPSIVGIDCMGVTELTDYMIKRLPEPQQSSVAQNIFLTGGNVLFPNFKERLERELLASRPYGSSFTVSLASDPLLDAWRGMAAWSAAPQFQQSVITRALYDEHGPQHLVQHMASNLYFIPSLSSADDDQQHA